MELHKNINEAYRCLLQGQIGKANSFWNLALPLLANLLQRQTQKAQLQMIPILHTILAYQEQKDWVAMADALKYSLLPRIDS